MTHHIPPLYDPPDPTPPLHDPPHPTPTCAPIPTPPLHHPPHSFMTHPTPVWPTPSLHDPPHPCMTHPTPMGAPFGRHAAIRLFHLNIYCWIFLSKNHKIPRSGGGWEVPTLAYPLTSVVNFLCRRERRGYHSDTCISKSGHRSQRFPYTSFNTKSWVPKFWTQMTGSIALERV